MSDSIDFKDLWNKQTAIPPNPEHLVGEIKKLKQNNLRKLVFTNMLLIEISVFITLIWIYYQQQLPTKKIGIIVIILSIIIFCLFYNKIY